MSADDHTNGIQFVERDPVKPASRPGTPSVTLRLKRTPSRPLFRRSPRNCVSRAAARVARGLTPVRTAAKELFSSEEANEEEPPKKFQPTIRKKKPEQPKSIGMTRRGSSWSPTPDLKLAMPVYKPSFQVHDAEVVSMEPEKTSSMNTTQSTQEKKATMTSLFSTFRVIPRQEEDWRYSDSFRESQLQLLLECRQRQKETEDFRPKML